jgi:N-acetylglucosamine malate deacetylase 1
MKAKRLLAIGPHPDDVEICCSGTVLKMKDAGAWVGIVDLTAGEMGTRGSREIRARECHEASQMLGLDHRECLDLGDSNLQVNRENEFALVRVLRALKPDLLLVPWGIDDHPDHEAAAKLIRSASFLSGMTKIETGQEAHRPQAILSYPGRREFAPSFIVDISQQWDRRMEAARLYQSQFYNPDSTEAPTPISSPDFWHFIEARAMYYGQLIGVRYGEAFHYEGTLEVQNPLGHFTS